MDIDWNAELVDQLEWHWQHQLRPRLDGLTDDEYYWQPVRGCWTISRRGQSPAPISLGAGEFTMDYAPPPHDREPVTTIAWRLAHLIDAFGPPTAPHFGDTPASHPAVRYPGTAETALRQLDDGHDAWVSDVRSLGTAGLARPQGPSHHPSTPMRRWRSSSFTPTSKSSTTARRSACFATSTYGKTTPMAYERPAG